LTITDFSELVNILLSFILKTYGRFGKFFLCYLLSFSVAYKEDRHKISSIHHSVCHIISYKFQQNSKNHDLKYEIS